MNPIIPDYISYTFILTTILTLFLFYQILKEAIPKQSKLVLLGLVFFSLFKQY